LGDLDTALDDALVQYSSDKDESLEKLRHMKREVSPARKAVLLYMDKSKFKKTKEENRFAAPTNRASDRVAFASSQDALTSFQYLAETLSF